MTQNLGASSLNSNPTTTGIFLKGSFKLLTEFHYPRIAKVDPRAKLMIYISEEKEVVIEEILRYGYDQYKFIEVAVMAILDVPNYGKIIKFCVYNPFTKINLCKVLTDKNVLDSMVEIKNFGLNRLKNLYGYPLKVITSIFRIF